jgi:hypothetical protein
LKELFCFSPIFLRIAIAAAKPASGLAAQLAFEGIAQRVVYNNRVFLFLLH